MGPMSRRVLDTAWKIFVFITVIHYFMMENDSNDVEDFSSDSETSVFPFKRKAKASWQI
jgi:hypothetical protein